MVWSWVDPDGWEETRASAIASTSAASKGVGTGGGTVSTISTSTGDVRTSGTASSNEDGWIKLAAV